MVTPAYYGGFADVWKCQYNGQMIAAKALRVYSTSDLDRIRRVGCVIPVMFINEPIASYTEVLQRSNVMENPLSSKRVAAIRCYDDREQVCDGIRVDG